MYDKKQILSLVERAQDGDRLAFESLYGLTSQSLFSFLLSEGLPYDEASDILQETYVRVWTSLVRLESMGSFVPWLYRIARNLIKDLYKSANRQHEIASEITDETIPELIPGPEVEVEEQSMYEEIISIISKLPDDQRLPIVLHHIQGLSVSEIAETLELSYGTVLSRMARGRTALARKLQTTWGNPKKENVDVL